MGGLKEDELYKKVQIQKIHMIIFIILAILAQHG
jgi:hypothetical protein